MVKAKSEITIEGKETWVVVLKDDTESSVVEIGCESGEHADQLAALLGRACYVTMETFC